jgi:hypothetical protein
MSLKTSVFAGFFITVMLFALAGYSQVQIRDSIFNSDMKLFLIGLGEDTRVIVMPVCKNKMAGIWLVHVHEDESTAADAALEYIDSTGVGCLVTLKHGMGRNISFNMKGKTYKFDPNRIYTAEGRKATLEKFGAYSDSAFSAVSGLANFFTSRYIDSNRLIIALHNNTNDGGLSITSYQKGGIYQNDASKVFVNNKEDPDDFFYTTSLRAFDFFKQKGFNVLLQNNATVTDDGSLSVYAGMKKIDYINIEAEHLKKDQQKKMIAAAMDYIRVYFSPKPVADEIERKK